MKKSTSISDAKDCHNAEILINRIKRIGRDDLNYKANLSKIHQLAGAKISVLSLTYSKL